jgi:MFS family permease
MLGLKRELWLLFALNLAVGFSSQFIQPLFPLYLESLNASEVEIGLVISLASVVSMSLMIPSSLLMNRIGKKKLLLLSVFLSFFPPFIIAAMNDWKTVTPFYLVFNASFSFFIVARMAMVSENATPNNRATLFGIMNLAWPISGIIAPVLSGYIVENHGWTPTFQVTSVIMAISFIPTLMLKEAVPIRIRPQESPERSSILERRYLPFITLIFLFHFASGMVEGVLGTVLSLFLKNQIRISESLIGLFFTVSNVLILLTQIPSGRLADVYGRKKVLVMSLLPVPVLFGLWLFIDNWMILLILYAASTCLRSMTWPSSLALLADYIPSELLGSAVGIRMTSIRLGSTFGPLTAGYLYSQVDYRSPFLASAILIAISIMVGLSFKEKRLTSEAQYPNDQAISHEKDHMHD